MKPWDILTDSAVEALIANAERILEDCGIIFSEAPRARRLLESAGASVRGERVHFPRGLARRIVTSSTPRKFAQRARDPAKSVTFGDGMPVFAPAFGAPFVYDPRGRRRHGRLEDLRTVAKLAQVAPQIGHAAGAYCEPTDRPGVVRHLDMLETVVRYSDKPFKGCARNAAQVADSLDVARLVFGERTFQNECCLVNVFNVRSPLSVPGATAEGLRLTAEANQGCVIASYAMMGMTGPATLAGTLSLMLAEVLAAAAYVQLVRPGAPVILGFYAVPFWMTTKMRPNFGGPESHIAVLAGGQLMRRLGIPFRGDGGLTSAKSVDGQGLSESACSLQAALMAGSDFTMHAAGWMEDGLALSCEKFVRDLEVLARLQGEAESLRSGPEDTLSAVQARSYSLERLLDTYERPEMPADTEASLEAFLRERKAAYLDTAS